MAVTGSGDWVASWLLADNVALDFWEGIFQGT